MKALRIAFLFAVAVLFAACSSTEDATTDKPSAPTGSKTYTMTINANKHGDTRVLTLDGNTLNSSWAEGDKITVYNETKDAEMEGYLSAQSSGSSTIFTGTLEGSIEAGDVLTLKFLSADYSQQNGTLASIASTCDYATASITVKSVNDGIITPTTESAQFANQQAIVKFTVKDASGTIILPTRFSMEYGSERLSLSIPSSTYETNGDGVIYIAIPAVTEEDLTLYAYTGTNGYAYTRSNATLSRGQYYAISVKMAEDMRAMPLTLEAISDGQYVYVRNSANGPVTYQVNDGTLQTIEAGATNDIYLSSTGDKVRFWGDNAKYGVNGSWLNGNASYTIRTGNCYVYGNIMSFITSTDYAVRKEFSEEIVFWGFFENSTGMKNHPSKSLVLPATTLTPGCYVSMFEGCKGLTVAPELPATTITSHCYNYMFAGCTSLETPPSILPATTLEPQCYCGMFEGCTSLATAPTISATTLAENCCELMFYNCPSLTMPPTLSATTLASSCYSRMFEKCSGLTSAPELPATTMANNCYYGMFYSCSELTSAPELPATTLAPSCYFNMFAFCTEIEEGPVLPATTLASDCYSFMFYGCHSLTKAPALPATTLATGCYKGMFRECTSLTTAPDIITPTTPANNSYQFMFYDCSSLNNVKCLHPYLLDEYFNWLSGVSATGTFTQMEGVEWPSGASGIPEGWTVVETGQHYETPLTLEAIAAGTITFYNQASGPVSYTVNGGSSQSIAKSKSKSISVSVGDKVCFYGNNATYGSSSTNYSSISCSADCYIYGNIMSLISSSNYENLKTLASTYTFYQLFYGNTHIKNHETKYLYLPATTLTDYCYYKMFSGCTGLTSAPNLPATTLAKYCYKTMFYGCTGLTKTSKMSATTVADECCYGMYTDCTNITYAYKLSATTLSKNCYYQMFSGCTKLTTAPELPAETLAESCYRQMFSGCTSLTTAPELRAETLAQYCYYQMFYGCTKLTTAPELPAKTLVNYCYQQMFDGCSKLNSIKCLATNISATSCLREWVKSVASSGTFTKANGMKSWPSGISGIPSNWTVEDAE